MTETDITNSLEQEEALGVVGSPSDSFEAIVDIREVSEESKLLGELVCFTVKEGNSTILVLGQITEIRTVNRWHEEPSFKGIIKRHGKLPNLSGVADNRIAKINVQSSFKIFDGSIEAHKLANSPSTGEPVKKINNEIMKGLMEPYSEKLVCIGRAYDTGVKIPFWFKHFGKPTDGGGGDAYHIGVFGRTGSGKTVTAANMILGYARSNEHISILILDPQGQFFNDTELLCGRDDTGKVSFKKEMKKRGMQFESYKVPGNIALPNDPELFSELALNYGFIRKAFKIHTSEKRRLMAESIAEYLKGRMNDPKFKIGSYPSEQLLRDMIKRFSKGKKYLENVYSPGQYLTKLEKVVKGMVNEEGQIDKEPKEIWNDICSLFKEEGKTKLSDVVEKVVRKTGNTVILDLSGQKSVSRMDFIQTFFVKKIEDAVKEKGAEIYAKGERSNCLVVLDEAHRYISSYSYDTEATAAEFVDDSGEKETIVFKDGGRLDFMPTAHHVGSIKNINRQDQCHVWLPFHFIPGNVGESFSERLLCRKDSCVARELIDHNLSHANKPYGLYLAGISAHVYADTFSHYGFSGVSSRWNRVVSSSFEFMDVEEETLGYIQKKSEEFQEKYGEEMNSLENFRVVSLVRNILSEGAEIFSGALGHGAVFTYPDRPYLKWKFNYEYPDSGRSSGLRDNPATFLEACEKLHGMFCRFAEKNPNVRQDQGRLFSRIKNSVQSILATQASREGREDAWKQAAEAGKLFLKAEKILPYQGEKWKEGIDTLKSSRDSHDALKEPVFRFYQAASIHRTFVLRELLPKYKLVID